MIRADMSQLPLSLAPPRGMRFDNFVAGPNRAVVDTLRRGLSAGDGYFLCGPRGSGKTHLALALMAQWSARAHRACFVPGAVPAAAGLLDEARPELAVVDDVEQLAGNATAERALFNAINRWREARTAVLLTGSGRIDFGLPDLASRVGHLARLTLQPLDDEGLDLLLGQLVEDFQLIAGRGMIDYLRRNGPRSPGRLVGLFERLARRAQAERRVVSVPMVREELAGPDS